MGGYSDGISDGDGNIEGYLLGYNFSGMEEGSSRVSYKGN